MLRGGEGYVPTGIEHITGPTGTEVCATSDPLTFRIVISLLKDPKFKTDDFCGFGQNSILVDPNFLELAERILNSRKDLLSYISFSSDKKPDAVKKGWIATPRQAFGVGFSKVRGRLYRSEKQKIEEYINWSGEAYFAYCVGLNRLPQITEIWTQKRPYLSSDGKRVNGMDFLIGWHSNGPELWDWLQVYDVTGHLTINGFNMSRPAGLPTK